MTKQGFQPTARPLRTWSFTLIVVVLSLNLQTLCQGQELGYFDNPIMKFGKMLYVSFINGTYDLFYECLCDIHITDCALNLTLAGSGFGFPYKYTVTNFRQTRAPDDTPLSELYRQYSSTFVCDAMKHVSKGGFNCRRRKVKDNTCVAPFGFCLQYKITHRLTHRRQRRMATRRRLGRITHWTIWLSERNQRPAWIGNWTGSHTGRYGYQWQAWMVALLRASTTGFRKQ
ncbi:hypothetical protein RRG08_049191 [Elysia crispata]|uniref:Uncharacterized protein n=1 Tax=Elysia crispata TaxID=231223 RepID=A0AAE1DZ35_9GAST|nr:hypothetical protein RRG08_049191 [Elysia crispata]